MSKWISVFWRIAAAALLIVALSGCFGKSTPKPSADQNQNQVPEGFTLPTLEGNPELVASYYLNASDAWLIYLRKTGVETPQVWTFYTDDKGQNWVNAQLPLKRQWEKEITKENVFVALPDSHSAAPGWIALVSKPDPSTNKTEKSLFRTTDHGRIWDFLGYLTNVVDGSMTGMTFITDKVGWISANYTGNTFVPFYHTVDGGKTWELQPLSKPEGFKYGNVMPPVFDPNNIKNGKVQVEFVGDNDKKSVVEFKTTDGGQNWTR